jgi:hypothetical protein
MLARMSGRHRLGIAIVASAALFGAVLVVDAVRRGGLLRY